MASQLPTIVPLDAIDRALIEDLLDAAFWQSHKERIAAGHVHDVFPYERDRRFLSHALA